MGFCSKGFDDRTIRGKHFVGIEFGEWHPVRLSVFPDFRFPLENLCFVNRELKSLVGFHCANNRTNLGFDAEFFL